MEWVYPWKRAVVKTDDKSADAVDEAAVVHFEKPYEVGVGADGSTYADKHYILHATNGGRQHPNRDNAVALVILANGPTASILPPSTVYSTCRAKLDVAFCNNVSIPTVALVHKNTLARNETLPLYAGLWPPASFGPTGPTAP